MLKRMCAFGFWLIFSLRVLSEQIAPKVDFESFQSDHSEVAQVFLPVQLAKAQEIYLWANHAINLERVICDGVELKAGGLYHGGNYPAPTKKPEVDEWLYPVSLPRLSAQVPAVDLVWPVREPYLPGYFDIPQNWLELIVVYRAHFPDGSVAPSRTIRIWRQKWWAGENIADQVEADARERKRIEAVTREAKERERQKQQGSSK